MKAYTNEGIIADQQHFITVSKSGDGILNICWMVMFDVLSGVFLSAHIERVCMIWKPTLFTKK